MELREKPGKVQKLLELSLRFRLIFVVLMVVFAVTFLAKDWQQMGSLPLGASEALGMWVAGFTTVVSAWHSTQYLFVAALSMIVLYFVFGGWRGGVAGLLALCAFVGSLFALGGDEDMLVIFFAAYAGLSLLFLLFVKWSVACALFPFALAWLLLTGFLGWFPLMVGKAWLMWAVLSSIGFSGVVACAVVAGKELGEGTPQAGSLVKAGKKMLLPITLSSLLALSAIVVDLGGAVDGKKIGFAAILWVAFNVWFFGFIFGTMSLLRGNASVPVPAASSSATRRNPQKRKVRSNLLCNPERRTVGSKSKELVKLVIQKRSERFARNACCWSVDVLNFLAVEFVFG